MGVINKDRFVGFDLQDKNDMLVSILGNRGKYLTQKECCLIEEKLKKAKVFSIKNDVEKLNREQ